MKKLKRKSGFYWVELNKRWLVAEWNNKFAIWFIPGREESFDEIDFDAIIEPNIKNPKKK